MVPVVENCFCFIRWTKASSGCQWKPVFVGGTTLLVVTSIPVFVGTTELSHSHSMNVYSSSVILIRVK